jgi:hypothetical protein
LTVCIAAICQAPNNSGPVIIGGADRMITSGGIQFEPPSPKIWQLSATIAVLIAGDPSAQVDVMQRIWPREPKTVQEAIQLYCGELGQYNRRNAERTVLYPLGLTMKTYIEQQRHMDPDFTHKLHSDIHACRAGIETIVCGIDKGGPQLYTIDEYCVARSQNSIGFAAIGSGRWYAESQFMFAKYNPVWPISNALLVLYLSKQRAEATQGVGQNTDWFSIAQDFRRIQDSDPTRIAVEKACERLQADQEKIMSEEYRKIEASLIADNGELAAAIPPQEAETVRTKRKKPSP